MKKTYYLDENNNIVSREKSTHFRVAEYDDKGNFIGETFGISKPISYEEEQRNMNVGEPSEEIQEFLNSFVDRHGNHPFQKK